MCRREVRVHSTKWDGSTHKDMTVVELGADPCGTWLWVPDGTPTRTPELTFLTSAGLRLFPVDAWWSAWFVSGLADDARPAQVYVDITTPALRTGDLIEFVDLDLDVERFGDGPVCVLDEDEFALHREHYSYPPELVDQAVRACHEVTAAVRRGEPPFGGEHLQWLERATRSG